MSKKTTETISSVEKENLTGKDKIKKVLKIILNTIINILIVAVLIVSIIVAALAITSKANQGISNIFGYTFQPILSDSMKGGSDKYEGGDFEKGDLIIGKTTDFDDTAEYHVGDIVTFQKVIEGTDQFVVHRIIEVKENEYGQTVYLTQGDNSKVVDQDANNTYSYLQAVQVGAVFYTSDYHGTIIKGLGSVLEYIQTQQGFFLVILLPMIAFFLYAIFRVVLSASNYKKVKQQEKEKDLIDNAEKEKQEAVEAAVKAALAEKNGEEVKSADTPADMTPEQMEQFKQFLAFQKAQKSQQSAETPESPAEEPAESTEE